MATSARSVAWAVLSRWRDLRDPPQIPERGEESWEELSARDRAFAFDLVSGVLRYRGLLDVLIGARLKRPTQLELPVRAILWLGVYQLLLQSGSRTYASVDSSVELAKRSGLARASGLVNAVLRGVMRMQPVLEIRHGLSAFTFPTNFTTQIRLNEPVFPDPAKDLPRHLSAVTSHPEALVARLIAAHGEAAAIDILIRNNVRPVVLVRADDREWTPPARAGLEPHERPGFFVAGSWNAGVEKLVKEGRVSPQDPTAAKAGEILAARVGGGPKRILDLCAGLGTKTMQLARALPEATVEATDIDARKLESLRGRAGQLGLANVRTIELGAVGGGKYDAVLVDVPCSNTGVMARRPQSRWRWPGLDVGTLSRTQQKLLEQAAGVMAPGGWIMYATCSIDPTENEEVVRRFQAEHGGMALVHEELTLPAATDVPAQQHDGGYVALLRVGG